MKTFQPRSKRKRIWRRLVLIVLLVLFIGIGGALIATKRVYMQNLRPVDATANQQVVVAIGSGSSLNQIAQNLETSNVVRAGWAFKQYVRSKGIASSLKAGTYRFTTSQDVASIARDLSAGKVAVDLFTILPGQRLDQIRQAFIKGGYPAAEVDAALNPENYKNHPALADKPAGVSLEGYLYPDSFQKTADTRAATIVTASLDELARFLTPELKAAYAKQGMTVYQAITFASVVEREVSSQNDRAIAAQVFSKRIDEGIRLQSDVTVLYGQAINGKDTKYVDTSYDTLYNTFLHDGLPVGPISNVTVSGLKAVANSASTDFLYFVAGDGDDYGKTYFSRTLAEHKAAVNAHCKTCSPQ